MPVIVYKIGDNWKLPRPEDWKGGSHLDKISTVFLLEKYESRLQQGKISFFKDIPNKQKEVLVNIQQLKGEMEHEHKNNRSTNW